MRFTYLIVDNSCNLWKTSLDFLQSLFRLILEFPPAIFCLQIKLEKGDLADKDLLKFFC